MPSDLEVLPYKVAGRNADDSITWVGYGIRETIGPCRIEPISSTPEGRLKQLKESGRLCDTCERWAPDHEVMIDIEDELQPDKEQTLVGYVCNECFEEGLDARKKAGVAEQAREASKIKQKMRAIKKAERKRRRNGRRGR